MKKKCLVLFRIPGKDSVQAIEEELSEEEQKKLREEILRRGGQITSFNTNWRWYQGGMSVVHHYPKP
jgi:hypothetical protein